MPFQRVQVFLKPAPALVSFLLRGRVRCGEHHPDVALLAPPLGAKPPFKQRVSSSERNLDGVVIRHRYIILALARGHVTPWFREAPGQPGCPPAERLEPTEVEGDST